MTTTDIFNFDDYRAFIKAYVDSSPDSWGLWAKLALAAGCQATYLSQAMRGKVQLTAEHIHGLAKYWNMSEAETDFFLLQLEFARAGTEELRDYYLKKIKKIRRERDDLSKRFQKERVAPGEKETLYYSAWYWSALHVMTTVPELQTAQAMATRLFLPVKFVESCLHKLEEQGFVKKEGKLWKLGTADVHIPKDSLMVGIHHNNWRAKAVADSNQPDTEGVHFTGVYSLSRSDYQHLKEKVLDLVEHSRRVIAPSKEEEVICFTCDFFKI